MKKIKNGGINIEKQSGRRGMLLLFGKIYVKRGALWVLVLLAAAVPVLCRAAWVGRERAADSRKMEADFREESGLSVSAAFQCLPGHCPKLHIVVQNQTKRAAEVVQFYAFFYDASGKELDGWAVPHRFYLDKTVEGGKSVYVSWMLSQPQI